MIILPNKFEVENNKAENTPAIFVKMVTEVLEGHETTEVDWTANDSESQVDYTTLPGDVTIERIAVPDSENLISDATIQTAAGYRIAQSFQQNTGVPRQISQVLAYGARAGDQTNLHFKGIHQGSTPRSPGNLLNTTINYGLTGAVPGWYDWNLTPYNTWVESGVTYWLMFEAPDAPFNWGYQTGNVYAYGNMVAMDDTDYPTYDLRFEVRFVQDTPNSYYLASGTIKTQAIDLGSTPSTDGIFNLSDTLAANTTVTYQAWASATGAFAGEEDDLGAVIDGDAITNKKRYYQIEASLANSNQSFTPILNSVGVEFNLYKNFCDYPILEAEPGLINVSTLDTKVDTFAASTISQISLTFDLNSTVATYLFERAKNKLVKVKLGFNLSTFLESDFIDYFWGKIDDWQIDKNDKVTIMTKDFKKEWKVDVPEKWEGAGDDVTWTAEHPSDVILDILQNQINVADSKIDLDSFATVKASLAGWVVTRTITDEQLVAKDLIEELRILMNCVFIPQVDGRIKIKEFDTSEAASVTWTDDDFISVKHEGNAENLINRTLLYYDWDGAGDDYSDYSELTVGLDSTSITNWGETKTKEIKDKWTLAAQSGQIDALEADILGRYADPPPLLTVEVDRRYLYIEVGDIATVTTVRGTASGGITAKNFQIVSKNLNHKSDRIRLKLLGVAGSDFFD